MDTSASPNPPSSPPFYAGEFRHAIDEKNRITIPSRWRGDGAEEFIILPEANHQFLMVMSPEEFSRMSAAAEATSQVSPRDRRVFFRQLHARAEHGASDRQGRLVLPEDLCKKLNLKGEVALVGGRGRLEIWNLARWKQANTDETSTYQHVAGVLGL
jgi:transcriptional regulator MraZ